MKTDPKNSPNWRTVFLRGFSMIELLVAMAITSIIMVTLFSLVGQSTASYTQTQRAVNAVSQARAFIQFFDRELSTRLPGTPLIQEKASGNDPESSARIAFVRALSSDELVESKPGDLGTSIYYVGYSTDGGSSQSPKLFRKQLDPSETQALIEAGATPPFPNVDPATDEAIVPNILSFQALPKYRDPANGELKEWIETSPGRPSVIELEITFVDESSAQRFKSKDEWNRLAASPRESELQLVRTFTRNIAIAK